MLFSSLQRSSQLSTKCQKNYWVLFPVLKPQLSFKCPILISGLISALLLCSLWRSHSSPRRLVTYAAGKYSTLQYRPSMEVMPRHLLCLWINGNILMKESEKDLSTTVTLATLAYKHKMYAGQKSTETVGNNHRDKSTPNIPRIWNQVFSFYS